MKTTSNVNLASLAGVLTLIVPSAQADTLGSEGNTFTIDFVNIGNAGNGGSTGYGWVGYNYRMGVTEAAKDWITKATNLGLANVTAGPLTGNQPATEISWYQAAAFVNFLNTSTGNQAAYNLTFNESWSMTLWASADAWQAGGEHLYRHKDAYYFLPSENEWYKAAYHKNDGVTWNYWDYATGSNTVPTPVASGTTTGTAVYGYGAPAAVNHAGGLSAYGTMGQNGNVWEWQEDPYYPLGYGPPSDARAIRGGGWNGGEGSFGHSTRGNPPASYGNFEYGFRVASAEVGTGSLVVPAPPPPLPEPSSALLMTGTGIMILLRRRRARE
jgi:formylglycine-generating enzyme